MRCAALLATALVAAALIAPGCAGTPDPIELTPSWPDEPASLERVTRSWTRSDKVVAPLSGHKELIADVRATFKSPAWRTALVHRQGKAGNLDAPAIEARIVEQKKAAAEHHEFVLLMTTHDSRINDLTKGTRSVWSIRLRDRSGAEVAPTEVKKDRRPRSEIATELPHLTDFDQIYIVKFPGSHPILGEGAGQFSLKIWSGRGNLELVWSGS